MFRINRGSNRILNAGNHGLDLFLKIDVRLMGILWYLTFNFFFLKYLLYKVGSMLTGKFVH